MSRPPAEMAAALAEALGITVEEVGRMSWDDLRAARARLAADRNAVKGEYGALVRTAREQIVTPRPVDSLDEQTVEAPQGWAQPGLFADDEIPQSSHQIDLPTY